MYIFLPRNRSNLQQFEQNLSSPAWDKWTGSFETAEGHLRLPRFKLTHGATLNTALDKLGMGIAFDSRRARFDAITATKVMAEREGFYYCRYTQLPMKPTLQR